MPRRAPLLCLLAIATAAAPQLSLGPDSRFALVWGPSIVSAQDHGTIVIVSGQFPSQPIPTLTRGLADNDIADLLFLRLARLGPTLSTAGDRDFTPQLAKSWQRRDSLTLVFELDPRARWQDGTPVTSRDVVWTFARAKDPALSPANATALRWVTSVTADGDRRVVVTFAKRYPTQFFDVAWQLPVLPAHLLDSIPGATLGTSSFARNPVGSGPYRFVRAVPGQLVELAAVPDHFLGAARIDRVVYRAAADGDARMNLLVSGEADGLEQLSLRSQQERLAGNAEFRLIPVPSFQVAYVLFNQKDPADRTKPHPILVDSMVRRALVLGLDRRALNAALYGDAATVPEGPASMSLWVRTAGPAQPEGDRARAAAMLSAAGWVDRDKDGVRERDGHDLSFVMIYPGTSPARRLAAQVVQEQWRQLGVKIVLTPLEFPAYIQRRNDRDFDLDLTGVVQDANPAGLAQGWSCGGGTNIGSYCDPAVDSLMARAEAAPDGGRALWQQVLRRIDADAPAAFLFAPANVVAVHRRYDGVVLRPEGLWSGLAAWRVRPGSQLPRDRTGAP
ncbi:MAG TPA: peptide ABC transporter substrate-binding protein [Gemmatimonadales bacterium]|nr:peptide ABC transporter substrate-binding protein [Gemmatimonadales bacterium]